jgi:hypothetical protein
LAQRGLRKPRTSAPLSRFCARYGGRKELAKAQASQTDTNDRNDENVEVSVILKDIRSGGQDRH